MPKNKQKRQMVLRRLRSTPVLVLVSCLVVGAALLSPLVRADQYDSQINALEQQNVSAQNTLNGLLAQANGYQATINQLQAQIAGLQANITANQAKQADLQNQIVAAQAELEHEKSVLANDIRSLYVSGQITPIEMLATSSSLSDYVDKQEAYLAVQSKIQSTLQQIASLQATLQAQKSQVDQLLKEQQQQQQQLSAAQSQANSLLAYNEGQQAAYDSQIQSNQSQIATLRAEQIAANRKLVGTGRVDYSGSCGGGYPASAAGPYGSWGCNYSLDNTIDNWGMYNRECVSYTAWMVYKTYGYMPYWGGVGDANQWPGDAARAGIPTGTTPKVNSVAIYMGGSGDPWGHAMWVKSVNGDGTITVDQYNLYYDGNFYETTIPASGLVYIYFS
ncbi:MAG TPA: CHAP domain-containing protein [Candidatus Saccharimonadales bacterium]